MTRALLLGAAALAGLALLPRRLHRGPAGDHFDGARFFNPGHPATDRSLPDLLRWRFGGRRAPWQPAPASPPARPAPRVGTLAVTLVGHASVLVQAAGCNILVDPVWSRRASPFAFAGPRRWDPPGIRFADLPPVDVVLLTHGHYDHMDRRTLRRLRRHHRPRVLAPLGNDRPLRRVTPVETGDWGDGFALAPGVRATIHPAYHWSARTPFDKRRALWSGWVIETPSGPVYLAGDTGYGDGAPFRLVRERFGPPRLAVLPIGAYEPRWFMRAQHVDPDEAVRILLDTGAAEAVGVHWGTFRLTDEARFAPPAALLAACLRRGVAPARFRALRPGDVWAPGPDPANRHPRPAA